MGSAENLQTFHNVTYLSALTVEAVVLWDDVTDKLEDDPALLTALRVTKEEVDTVSRLLRRFMDHCHDHKTDLQNKLEAAMRPTPAPAREFEVDRMWEEAEAAHPGPSEFESVLLPKAGNSSEPGP